MSSLFQRHCQMLCYISTKLASCSTRSGEEHFWSELRKSDPHTHKQAVAYQGCLRRKQKAKLDHSFLLQCKKLHVYPKFIKWMNIDMLPRKKQNRYHRLLLTDAIKDKNLRIVNLSKQCSLLRTELFAQFLIIFSINRLLKSEMAKVRTRHNKKMDNLLSLKQAIDGLQENPNDVILNLSGQDFSDDQIDVFKLGLRHSFATRPSELEMMSISEDLWDQINELDQFKDGSYIKHRHKNSTLFYL